VTTARRVSLSVYDLSAYNEYLQGLIGGVYHVGVVYRDVEWSFASIEQGTGVFWCEPRKCDIGTFKKSINVGESSLSVEEVLLHLRLLLPTWKTADYNSISKNCIHFAQTFLNFLIPHSRLPAWLTTAHESLRAFSSLTDTSARKKDNAPMYAILVERMLKETEKRMNDKNVESVEAVPTGPAVCVIHGKDPTDVPVRATLDKLESIKTHVNHKYSTYALAYIKMG